MGLNQCCVILVVLAVCCVLMIPTREQLIHSKAATHQAVLVRNSFPVNEYNNNNNDCSSSWGVFIRNQSLLTETQVMPHIKAPPFNLSSVDDSFQGLFVDPAHKFAFCAIPKNAVTQWKTVLRNVFRNFTENGFTSPAFGIGKLSQEKHGVEAIKAIFESPFRTVAVMV